MGLYFIHLSLMQQIIKFYVLHVYMAFLRFISSKAFKFIIRHRKVMRLEFAHTYKSAARYVACFPLPEGFRTNQMHSWMKVMRTLSRAGSPQTLQQSEGQDPPLKESLDGRKTFLKGFGKITSSRKKKHSCPPSKQNKMTSH